MRVRCIDNNVVTRGLTVGQEYNAEELEASDPYHKVQFRLIGDDRGINTTYLKRRFVVLPEETMLAQPSANINATTTVDLDEEKCWETFKPKAQHPGQCRWCPGVPADECKYHSGR